MKFWGGSWGIQARMNLLALGPASLIACLLVAYFTYNRIGDAEQRLRELGTASAKHIGASAEFSVITGNVPQLQKLVTSVVKQGEIQSTIDKRGSKGVYRCPPLNKKRPPTCSTRPLLKLNSLPKVIELVNREAQRES